MNIEGCGGAGIFLTPSSQIIKRTTAYFSVIVNVWLFKYNIISERKRSMSKINYLMTKDGRRFGRKCPIIMGNMYF